VRIFLDTNIFLYAVGQAHPLRAPCADILRRVAAGTLQATTNAGVVQEILYVLVRRNRRNDARKLASSVASLFPDLLPVTQGDLLAACDLLGRYSRLSVRDSVHAATMLGNGMHRIASVDPDFDQVKELQRVDPASL